MKIDVLDHGFVRFVESWGGGDAQEAEAGVIEAARQSTQGAFRGWDEDAKLLRFLFMNKPPHSTPFEFAGMVLEIRAPIFVFREWHRHRSQSYNEMSARYAPLPDLNYMPTIERIMAGGTHKTSNRQAQAKEGAEGVTEKTAQLFQKRLIQAYDNFEDDYQDALATGVPKELARCGMPVGRYSQMRAHTCLRNWLAFLTLRMDPGAQWEIRQYANAVGQLIAREFPRTWEMFEERRAEGGTTLNHKELQALQDGVTDGIAGGPLLNDGAIDWWRRRMDAAGITSKRERGAFLRKLGVID